MADSSDQKKTFEDLALPLAEPLYRTAVRLCRNEALAKDLVQETFFKAYRSFDQFEPGTNLKAWLFKILRNNFLNAVTKDKPVNRDVPFEELDDFYLYKHLVVEGEAPAWDRKRMEEFFGDEVKKALDELPQDYREPILLCDIEGFCYDEISKILDVPVGTVRSRLHRGRRLLQKRLADYAVEKGLVKKK